MTTLAAFYRDGSSAGQVPAERFTRGKADNQVTERITCGRCGGQGGGEQWKYTGWTCYECGGAGKVTRTFNRPLYTAERLASLNASAVKRQAKRQAEAEAKAAGIEAERVARSAAFAEANGAWLDNVRPFAGRSEFIADVIAKAERNKLLTDGQRQAVDSAVAKMRAGDAERAASDWLGQEGERVTFTATVERAHQLGVNAYGETRFAITLKTEAGDLVTYFGFPAWLNARVVRLGNGWNAEADYEVTTGNLVTLKATIKKRDEYRGAKVTIIARPKEMKAKP